MPRKKKADSVMETEEVMTTQETEQKTPVRRTRKKAEGAEAAPARRPYPSREVRLEAANRDIERLEKLVASREKLVAETQDKLDKRTAALNKAKADLDNVNAKKEKIITTMNRPPKAQREKLSPEELKERRVAAMARARAAREEKRSKMNKLIEAIEASGKSLDEFIDEL